MFRILMISKTPLVGSPLRLKYSLEKIKYKVDLFHLEDYPDLEGIFEVNIKKNIFLEIENNIDKYDFVWIHNLIDLELLSELKYRLKCKFILQVHSGTLEGPLFEKIFLDNYIDFFDNKFVVSQSWAKQYPDFSLIPNIPPILNGIQDNKEKYNILFSPTHNRGGVYGHKNSDLIERVLNDFYERTKKKSRNKLFINIQKKKINQNLLMSLRRNYHFTIDEFGTGGFHQVSLEAINTGGLAINGSDEFTNLIFQNSIECDEKLPFIKIESEEELDNFLSTLLNDKFDFKKNVEYSRYFSKKYLDPIRLANIIDKKLQKIND